MARLLFVAVGKPIIHNLRVRDKVCSPLVIDKVPEAGRSMRGQVEACRKIGGGPIQY